MRLRVLALLPLLAPAPLTAQANTLAARTDSIARAVLASTGEPSASVAIVLHGRLAYAQAYGTARLESHTPATLAMRYGIGSVSKQVTAAAMLLLQEEGKLRLDDPVERWVPGLTRGRDVTLRQLLSHTSGYQDFWPQDYVMPGMLKPITPAGILGTWGARPLDFKPGARWQYSNTNYTIAALAIEKASGVPFYSFIRRRILEPLGMTSASDFDSDPHAVDPVGYMRYALGPLHPSLTTGAGWLWGAGELAMTPSDLAKWDLAMINRTLLRPESWREMEHTVLLNDGTSSNYGLGVFTGRIGGHRLVEHSGEVAGFTAENQVFPDDSTAVIVLVNQDAATSTSAIASAIARTLFTTDDSLTTRNTARVRRILDGLAKGTIDRALFTPNANFYFNDVALRDFRASLAPLGAPLSVVETRHSLRGGMTGRSYSVRYPSRTLRLWTFETPAGLLEQLQIAPEG